MKKLLFLLFLSSVSFATVPATTYFECRTTGTAGNLNGCAFDYTYTGQGTDFSQQDGFQSSGTVLATTDGLGTSSCTVSAAGYTWGPEYVGNGIHLSNGASWTTTGAGSWHIINSTNATGLAISGPCGSANSLSNGTFYIGGACSLNSTFDSDLFQNGVSGNKFWIKNGSFTVGESVASLPAGSGTNPIVIEGYNVSHGDTPTYTSRPQLNLGASFTMTGGQFWDVRNIRHIGLTASFLVSGPNGKYINDLIKNTSSTSGRTAFVPAADTFLFNSEVQSYKGTAISAGGTPRWVIAGNYIHDSDTGIGLTASSGQQIILDNLIVNIATTAISLGAGVTQRSLIAHNTLYGGENKIGNNAGITFTTTLSRNMPIYDNIIYGFATGTKHVDAPSTNWEGFDEYNDYFNNGTDASNWIKGVSDVALNPVFANVTQLTNNSAGYTVGTCGAADNTLTVSGGTFSASGVTTSMYVYLSSGTNLNPGIYGITAVGATTLTLDSDCSASTTGSNIAWQLTLGNDFRIGPNLKGQGFPGTFNSLGQTTTGYMDIGAVQRQEPTTSSSNGNGTVFDVRGGKFTVQGGKVTIQ